MSTLNQLIARALGVRVEHVQSALGQTKRYRTFSSKEKRDRHEMRKAFNKARTLASLRAMLDLYGRKYNGNYDTQVVFDAIVRASKIIEKEKVSEPPSP
jgi:hypothetical protein